MTRLVIKEPIEIDSDAFDSLIDFLLGREYDIAVDMEDFGCLKAIFRDLFGQDAEKSEVS